MSEQTRQPREDGASPAALPDPRLTVVRRPPAPSCGRPVVTRLVPPDTGREPVPTASVQGTLALDLGRPAPPTVVRDLRVVEDEQVPTSTTLPGPATLEVRAWAGRFAQAVVEVIGGDRPVSQLLRCTSPRVYQEIGRRAQILARTAPATTRRRTLRPQVRSVHVFQPTSQAAEVCVHVRHGERSRALAARLEKRDGRWTCTALTVG